MSYCISVNRYSTLLHIAPLRITFIFLVMFQDEHLLDWSNLWLMYYPFFFYLTVLANLLLFFMGWCVKLWTKTSLYSNYSELRFCLGSQMQLCIWVKLYGYKKAFLGGFIPKMKSTTPMTCHRHGNQCFIKKPMWSVSLFSFSFQGHKYKD